MSDRTGNDHLRNSETINMNEYTEDEASLKWCPFVRFNDSGCNRHTMHDDCNSIHFAKCISSKCMMWKYSEIEGLNQLRSGVKSNKGYCGLTK